MSKEPIKLDDTARQRLGQLNPDGTRKSVKQMLLDASNDPNHPLAQRSTAPAQPFVPQEAVARTVAVQKKRDLEAEAAKPVLPDNPWRRATTGDPKKDAVMLAKADDYDAKRAAEAERVAARAALEASEPYQTALATAERRVGIAKDTPQNNKAFLDYENLRVSGDVAAFNVESEKTLAAIRADIAEKKKALSASLSATHLESANLTAGEKRIETELGTDAGVNAP